MKVARPFLTVLYLLVGCLLAVEGRTAEPAKGKAEPKAPKEAPKHDLETWGQIKPIKGTDFWYLSYIQVDERRRARKKTAMVKVTEESVCYTDTVIRPTDIKEAETVWLFGKRFEQEAPSLTGYVGVDRQMRNVSALMAGELVKVNTAYKDRRDDTLRWYEAKISKAGEAGISVAYDSQEYKVVMLRAAPIVRRVKGGDLKKLKSGMRVAFFLDKTEERPDTKKSSDAKLQCYVAKAVVILDPRLVRSLYPMLFK